jgi:5-methylcytosine-specific restriction endonuclease McrA
MIFEELVELGEMLKRISEALDSQWKSNCVRTVHRNGDLTFMTAADPGAIKKAVQRMILDGAERDGLDLIIQGSIEADVEGCRGIVEHAIEQLREKLGAVYDEKRSTQASAEELKRRVDALLARRREHAINSPEVRAKVWAITEGRCIYCDVELTRERDPEDPQRCFVVDHVVPKAAGGPDHLTNYVPACASCNGGKAARPWFDFVRKRHAAPDLKIVGGSEA